MENDIDLPLFILAEIINLVINIAQNKEVIIPIINVVANPLIGPVPNEKRIIPVNKVVTFASIIEEYAALCIYERLRPNDPSTPEVAEAYISKNLFEHLFQLDHHFLGSILRYYFFL